MNTPSPDGQANDQPRQRLQSAFPAPCVFLTDHLQGLQFGEGDCVAELSFDEFGNLLGNRPSSEGPYEFDPNLGLHHVSARHFDPSSGSWMTTDVLGFPPEAR